LAFSAQWGWCFGQGYRKNCADLAEKIKDFSAFLSALPRWRWIWACHIWVWNVPPITLSSIKPLMESVIDSSKWSSS
jgi:hypothetical protein